MKDCKSSFQIKFCKDFLARQQKEPLMTHKIPETPKIDISKH